MSRSAPNPSLVDVDTTDGLDFKSERDRRSDSWTRADPRAASIARFGRFGFLVSLPDGDEHAVALARENGHYTGRCDCPGFEYHAGPCAHLCVLRKAEFGYLVDVETVDEIADEHELSQQSGDVMADRGYQHE